MTGLIHDLIDGLAAVTVIAAVGAWAIIFSP